MNADRFSSDVQEFLRLLAKHEVRYLIIGGIAVIYYGHGRLTGDVDFLYDCSADNVRRLWAALSEFWGGSVPAVDTGDELTNPELVVQFGRPPNRIDLIASLKSVAFADAWRNRTHESIECGGATIPIWLLSLSDLRASKLEAGRAKDLDDLEHLPKN